MEQRDNGHLTEAIGDDGQLDSPIAAAMRATTMPTVITDPRQDDNPIIFANEAFHHLTGYDRSEVLGRNCRFLQGADTDIATVAQLRRAIVEEIPVNVDLLNYRKDGGSFWNALLVSPVRGPDGQVHYFVASQMDISARMALQSQTRSQRDQMESAVRTRTTELEQALEAKTILLHELDHRVKNNLTMIGSLLRLQSRSLADPKLRSTLEQMLQRVDALATVHRRLYQSQNIEKFDIGAFAASLAHDLLGASGRRDIVLSTDVTAIEIPARNATPVGLILNELITNAIKHAYAHGRSGEIHLSIRKGDGCARMDVFDDGPGFDVSVRPLDSIGRTLIERLARQAKAVVSWNGNAPGTHVSITLPFKD